MTKFEYSLERIRVLILIFQTNSKTLALSTTHKFKSGGFTWISSFSSKLNKKNGYLPEKMKIYFSTAEGYRKAIDIHLKEEKIH